MNRHKSPCHLTRHILVMMPFTVPDLSNNLMGLVESQSRALGTSGVWTYDYNVNRPVLGQEHNRGSDTSNADTDTTASIRCREWHPLMWSGWSWSASHARKQVVGCQCHDGCFFIMRVRHTALVIYDGETYSIGNLQDEWSVWIDDSRCGCGFVGIWTCG